MKNEITLLKEENNRLHAIINALSEKLVVVENLLCAYEKNNVCIPNASNTILENKIGIIDLDNAMLENKIGISSLDNAIHEKKVGITNLNNAMLENKIDTPGVSYDTNTDRLGIKKINIAIMMNQLKAVMKTCPDRSLNNTAKVLIYLYDNPKNSLQELRKVVGLSLDGMAKHIRAMRKRNLIIKVSFQQYALTSMTIKMLENSLQ